VHDIGSILVALDRGPTSRHILLKAVTVARRFGARLHLFLCDAERVYVSHHQYEAHAMGAVLKSAVGEAHEFLQNLWNSLAIDDVRVDFDAGSESPLCEAIVHKVRRTGPDLVIRAIGADGTGQGSTLTATDFELVRTCQAPLLLTRGRPWSPTPQFAAAIDLSGDEQPQLTQTVLHCADVFASHCGASLDLIYGAGEADAAARRELEHALAVRAQEAQARTRALHVIGGDCARTLPEFIAARGYDLIALGALTHRKALTALVGTFTGRLIERADCDFLLVKLRARRVTSRH